jgi:hypothetical protein
MIEINAMPRKRAINQLPLDTDQFPALKRPTCVRTLLPFNQKDLLRLASHAEGPVRSHKERPMPRTPAVQLWGPGKR